MVPGRGVGKYGDFAGLRTDSLRNFTFFVKKITSINAKDGAGDEWV
jgi:hypothetical protein